MITKQVKHRTELITWRGGSSLEFVCEDITDDRSTQPPWYVIHISGGVWDGKGWYYWLDYQGPPMVFLTKRRAEIKAIQLRHQFGRGKFRSRVRVVELMVASRV